MIKEGMNGSPEPGCINKGGFRRRDTARGHPSNPPPLSLFNGRWASKRI